MFLFKEGQFRTGECSFILPDGFYLEDGDGNEDRMIAKTSDKRATVIWRISDSEDEIEESLKRFLSSEPELTLLSELLPLTVNNLSGYQIFLKDGSVEIFEAKFPLTNNKTLTFIVETRGRSILDLIASPEIHIALNGLHAI